MMILANTSASAAATGAAGGKDSSNWFGPYSACTCSNGMPASAAEVTRSFSQSPRSSSADRPYGTADGIGSAEPSGSTRTNSNSWPIKALRPAVPNRCSTRRSTWRVQVGAGVPSWRQRSVGAQARPSPRSRIASRSIRSRRSPTALIPSVKAMPPSTANTSHTGAEPVPDRAKSANLAAGTLLARVRPAALIMVPSTTWTSAARSCSVSSSDGAEGVWSLISTSSRKPFDRLRARSPGRTHPAP